MLDGRTKIYTIGFTKKTAQQFFELLIAARPSRIVDIRLNNVSQLAGFAKKHDLEYFAKTICGIDYVHTPELAPTKEMLDAYKKHKGSWQEFEECFRRLMQERQIECTVKPDMIHDGVLLCSEHEPEHCHRRLVAEYLREKWGTVAICHL